MRCDICEKELKDENYCELCNTPVCMEHAEFNDEILTCYYCLGKSDPHKDRDNDDFRGTGE